MSYSYAILAIFTHVIITATPTYTNYHKYSKTGTATFVRVDKLKCQNRMVTF
jgi:hypothetical protein